MNTGKSLKKYWKRMPLWLRYWNHACEIVVSIPAAGKFCACEHRACFVLRSSGHVLCFLLHDSNPLNWQKFVILRGLPPLPREECIRHRNRKSRLMGL